MNWQLGVQCLNLALGLLLIARLISVKLHKVYKLFCFFLIADLFGSALWVLNRIFGVFSLRFYWFTWLTVRPIVWLLTLLMIYSLLERILVQLPGLLRLSKRVLHSVFLVALAIGLVSAWFEYSAPGITVFRDRQLLVRFWMLELVFDRAIASAALLSLVAILAFLLWFPVSIPRNLAVFSIGFTVYFAAMTVLLLARSLWPNEAQTRIHQVLLAVSILIGGVSSACFAFWIFFVSPMGEVVRSPMAVQRQPQEQERLIAQLELLNNTLLKAARR
jgi:hypothetical protein